nr:TRAP transporter large permease subunit [Synergistaceae bacterium]
MIYVALLILLSTLMIGVPVPVSFMSSAAWLIFFGGPDGAGYTASQLLPYGFTQMNSVSLIAIALFIMAGGIMERGGIGEKLIDLVDVFVGHLRGGLGIVGTVSCAVFGSISGAACATLSCIGSIMFPRFRREGYPRGHAAALMANASLLGLLIPPNATLIIFAWISGQSVLACFLSTVVPGIVTTILICLVNMWLLRNNKDVLVAHKRDGAEKWKLFKERGRLAIPALMLPVIVLGGIYGGIMTTTEASAVAVLYAIPVGMFIY